MDKLIIEGTKNTPDVLFDLNGVWKMKGRLITEDAEKFFIPIMNWMNELSFKNIEFTINLDYLNTSASKFLFTLLRLLDENCEIDKIHINWYYEDDDEDHHEVGEYFEESLTRVKFDFYPVSELSHAA